MIAILSALKEATGYSKETAFIDHGLKVRRVSLNPKILEITDKDKKGVRVTFKKPHELTIFEEGLLYSLFVLKKKPRDYANYFKCFAGKEFLDSVAEIEVAVPEIQIKWRMI